MSDCRRQFPGVVTWVAVEDCYWLEMISNFEELIWAQLSENASSWIKQNIETHRQPDNNMAAGVCFKLGHRHIFSFRIHVLLLIYNLTHSLLSARWIISTALSKLTWLSKQCDVWKLILRTQVEQKDPLLYYTTHSTKTQRYRALLWHGSGPIFIKF